MTVHRSCLHKFYNVLQVKCFVYSLLSVCIMLEIDDVVANLITLIDIYKFIFIKIKCLKA